jgi:hypothetical protein
MLPSEPRVSTASEVEIFHAIRVGLDDRWTAVHSLGMAVHPKKPWTEVDFVIIGPPGVFCIEVKGGIEISRHGMKWTYRDQQGRTVIRNESPFEQVGSATAALRRFLVDCDRRFVSTLVGYGVATPYVDFVVRGPEVIPEVVYDADDVHFPFSRYLESVAEYWVTRLEEKGTRELDEEGRRHIVRLLAGDFELVRGLAGRIGDVGRTLIRLTDEQRRVLEGVQNDRILVQGGAGTGKTLLAVKLAVASAQAGTKTMLTCYSKRLGEWLGEQTEDVEGLTTVSLHRYMHDLLERSGRLSQLPPADDDHLMQVEYPRQAAEAMLELEITGTVERLIVDEAQDLVIPGYLDFFDQLLDNGVESGRWTMFFDPNQNLFEKLGGRGMDVLQAANPAMYRLGINCRNTKQIAYEAGMLARFEPTETLETDGPDVVELWYRDAGDQRRQVDRAVSRLLSQGVEPRQITVLSPYTLKKSAMAGGFENVPFQLSEKARSYDREIEFSTIQGFKGLESDVVVVVDIAGIESPGDRYLIYVATTRARAHLLVALPDSLRLEHQEAADLFGSRFATRLEGD